MIGSMRNAISDFSSAFNLSFMPALYILCPITGNPVDTGKVVPKTMPADHLIGNLINCKECNRLHKWNGKDSFFINEEGKRKYLK